jgi:ribosomal protein S18 acetylase RimI-like enzyme
LDQQFNFFDYQQSDFDGLMEMWLATGLGDSKRGDNHQIIIQTLEKGGKLILLKTSSLKIIGSSWMTTDGRRLYLHHFGILPECQGKGLAKLLMAESMKFAKQTGLQIKLEVHTTNLKAINLYKKYGFKYLGDYDVYIIRETNVI